MVRSLHIRSEIGKLRTVLVHRPGEELLNLSPSNLDRLLFDDIPYLEVAQSEHDVFARMLADEGVEVVYLRDLVTEALATGEAARSTFIDEYVRLSGLDGSLLPSALAEHLMAVREPEELATLTMAGVRSSAIELPSCEAATSLADVMAIEEARTRPLLADPIPNLYFTRDTFSVIGEGVSINRMWSKTRRREAAFAHAIFAHHPRYAGAPVWYDQSDAGNIEGGDILVLSESTVCVGISERTSAQAVDVLARRLLPAGDAPFSRVLALRIPEARAFMHLDTVLTQVDVDAFTVHPSILGELEIYEVTRSGEDIALKRLDGSLDAVLSQALGLDAVRLIKCGGDDPIAAAREQWNDGSNTLAVRPGRIFVYQRNRVTNEILYKAGLELLEVPSAELLRGRGGPHCMSMALVRDDI